MAQTVLHVANQLIPIPTPKTVQLKASLPPPQTSVYRRPLRVPCKLLRKRLIVKASSPLVVDGDAVSGLEWCFRSSPSFDSPASFSSSSAVVYGPAMKGGRYGAFGATTLEKSKLNMTQKQSKSSPEAAIGGDGNDDDNFIDFGGGDRGEDNGNGGDDDYFNDFNDGDDGGLFRRRIVLQELLDKKFVDAVLNEWQKTMMDLPPGLR